MNLNSYSKNIYSQNGEDGIISEILKRLSINSGWFVEFGAHNGKLASNTRSLAEKGWSGIYIEGDREKFTELQKNVKNLSGKINCLNSWVTPQNINDLFKQSGIKKDFDLLSIDIDGYDYQVWKGLTQYNPIIVIIEINSSLPVGVQRIHKEGKETGTSFSSMLELGKEKGYFLICHTGNMIFIRNDFFDRLNLTEKNPEKMFQTKWVKKSR